MIKIALTIQAQTEKTTFEIGIEHPLLVRGLEA
jgi:hypothetical protein